jgi:hypothetical protein
MNFANKRDKKNIESHKKYHTQPDTASNSSSRQVQAAIRQLIFRQNLDPIGKTILPF